MCFAPQRRALFRHLNFQKWSENGVLCTFWLRNVLRATTGCNFSSLIWPAGSAPAALASLLFDPPEPQIIGKTQCFATFPPFRASASSFFWLFLFSDLLSSVTLPTSTFHLSILSEVWLLNFLRLYNVLVCLKVKFRWCRCIPSPSWQASLPVDPGSSAFRPGPHWWGEPIFDRMPQENLVPWFRLGLFTMHGGGKGERDQSKPDGLMTRNVNFTRIYRTCTCFLGLSHHNSLNCQFICVGIQLIHVVQGFNYEQIWGYHGYMMVDILSGYHNPLWEIPSMNQYITNDRKNWALL